VVAAASPPIMAASRQPLGPKERAAVIALLDAVDAAQRNGVDADARVLWDAHVLKSAARRAYVPFLVSLDGLDAPFTSGAIYVRAVTRPRTSDGSVAVEQHSELRSWLRGAQPAFHMGETVSINAGELPVGGPAVSSSRRSTQAAAESFAVLELQRRAMEKDKAEAAAAQKRAEERDPSLFPFEEYYFFDGKSFRDVAHRIVGRAIPLPPGEYDLYIAITDRSGKKPEPPVILERRLTVPDFWNDELRLSSLILTGELQMRSAPLVEKERGQQPYTFGLAAVAPTLTGSFTTADVLTIVYQICNYGSPDSALTADYRFFRVDGQRRLFNGTQPQTFGDEDLPPSTDPWETQAFAMQLVPLTSFPPGHYEVEVTVNDRLTRASAKAVAAFAVKAP
jgi:hypothetical protein